LKIGHYPVHHGGLGIVRSLGMLGIPVYSVIEDRFAPAALSRHLAGRFVWDTRGLKRPQLLEGLALIGTTLKQRTILIPTDDFAAILIAEENAFLRQWYVFPETRSDVPRSLANKMLLHTLCTEMNVPSPLTLVPKSLSEVHAFIETTTFPVVAKPSAAWLPSTSKTTLVYSSSELLAIYRRGESEQLGNLVIQEYIPDGEDWFFHGYCNAKSDCLAGFTGRKLRSFPPGAGITTLGRSVRNDALSRQSEDLLKAIPYAGIMDIDYRFDRRDGKYKLLDFNPRIGAQFRLFEDSEGLDVARVLYRDLTGQAVRRSQQIDGKSFIVEPHDCRASFYHFRRRELSARDWCRSLKGPKEFAWFRRNDPLPFLMVWIHLAFTRAVRVSNLLCSRLLHSSNESQDPEQHRKFFFRVFNK
jgi:predicted ATP-grasp superfamily ATP-dependent carboligase